MNNIHILDINECAVNNGGCEDFCENTPGSFKCKCTKGGWELNADGRTCFENQTCSALDDIPEGGATTCTRQEDTNGVFCRLVNGFHSWLKSSPKYPLGGSVRQELFHEHHCKREPNKHILTRVVS